MDNGRGLLLTLHDGGRALKAERSLPKALTGQNVEDLRQVDVEAALAVVDEEIAEALVPGLPPLGEWMPTRVDYCESIRLGDEALVLRTLDRLAGIDLPWKGLPVRGESRSVSWAKGSIRPKFYSKYLECHLPSALGVLRFESGVFRHKGFVGLVGRVEAGTADEAGPAIAGASRPARARPDLRLVDVLRPEMWGYVRGRYADRFGGGLMSKDELDDVSFVRELVSFFGARRAAALIGYCSVAAVFGAKTRAEILGVSALSLSTRYRVLADIRAFREHVYGADVGEDEETDDALIARLSVLRAA